MKIDGIEVTPKLTQAKVMAAQKKALSSSTYYPAFCISCGSKSHNDPDAARDTCKKCGKATVYGIENLVLYFC